MKRRTFFRRLLGGLGATVTGAAARSGSRRVVLAQCRLAGFQFHAGESVWASLGHGTELQLVREPENEHDARAVAVYFHAHKLGYVPRGDNKSIADLLDRGETLEAHIARLSVADDPWERVRISIALL